MDDNALPLILVAFTGEEEGGYGSRYFTGSIHPYRIVSLCNIELCNIELCNIELCNIELCNIELCNIELCNIELCNIEITGTAPRRGGPPAYLTGLAHGDLGAIFPDGLRVPLTGCIRPYPSERCFCRSDNITGARLACRPIGYPRPRGRPEGLPPTG